MMAAASQSAAGLQSPTRLVLEHNDFEQLLHALIRRDYRLVGPTVREGAIGYLPKPADADEILAALNGTQTAKQPGIETPSLARAEWEHIMRVLADCNGNVSEAARKLAIHRRSLQRKLSKLPPLE